jgi:hypothetical protein
VVIIIIFVVVVVVVVVTVVVTVACRCDAAPWPVRGATRRVGLVVRVQVLVLVFSLGLARLCCGVIAWHLCARGAVVVIRRTCHGRRIGRSLCVLALLLPIAACDTISNLNPFDKAETYKPEITPSVPAEQLYNEGLGLLSKNEFDSAAKKFAEIQEAYDVLSDEAKRKNYDQFGHDAPNFAGAGRAPRGGAGAGAPWQDGDPGADEPLQPS